MFIFTRHGARLYALYEWHPQGIASVVSPMCRDQSVAGMVSPIRRDQCVVGWFRQCGARVDAVGRPGAPRVPLQGVALAGPWATVDAFTGPLSWLGAVGVFAFEALGSKATRPPSAAISAAAG